MKRILGILAVAFVGGLLALGADAAPNMKNHAIYDQGYQIPASFASYKEGLSPVVGPDLTSAAEIGVRSVVHINTEYKQKSNYYNYFFDLHDFLGDQQQAPALAGSGSGVIVSEDGYIITNNHVVDEASSVKVTLDNKRTYTAKVIGTDPMTDLALIKIDVKNLSTIPFGNSDQLRLGEWVLAVGNPFNLNSTVTAGIVSAMARDINIISGADGSGIESFIQTDAVVNKGNSGGALVNQNGELIGINAAIASPTGYYTGYSFAIPINLVKKVYKDLKESGKVHRGYMGVMFGDITGKFADDNNLRETEGVYVDKVLPNTAAEQAGIKAKDIVVAVENITINSASQLKETIATKNPGDKIKISLVRDNKPMELYVVLKEQESQEVAANKLNSVELDQLGATLIPVPDNLRAKLGLKSGLQVEEIKDGLLSNAGIKKGFIITQVDKKPVRSVEELMSLLQNTDGGILLEGVYPTGMRAYYGFGL
jgi:Do/DeqQ family serine protease